MDRATGLKDITLLVAYDKVRDNRFSSFTSDERRIRYHRQYFYFWNKLITKLKTQEKELGEWKEINSYSTESFTELLKACRDAQLEYQGIKDQFYTDTGES